MKISEQNDISYRKEVIGSRERVSYDVLYDQKKLIVENELIQTVLDSVPVYIAVLNSHRQIVYINRSFQEYLNQSVNDVLGKRPGEAVHCIHSNTGAGGCGTSKFCSNCGALHAILGSYKGKKTIEECRISIKNNHSLDLMVWSTPLTVQNHELTLFAMSDVSNDNRRKALERIFFHDILNTAGGIRGFVDLVSVAKPEEQNEYFGILQTLTEKLIDEIHAQRTISQAENGDLDLNVSPFSTREILEEVKMLLINHEVGIGKHIEIKSGTEDLIINSDKTVLRRIIVNLTKNALEASKETEIVFLSCSKDKGFVEFHVENPSFIPEEIQMQLFQRSFSTKGTDRGLGTYSVKLLTENYLNGEVNFVSTQNEGTVFKVRYPKSILV